MTYRQNFDKVILEPKVISLGDTVIVFFLAFAYNKTARKRTLLTEGEDIMILCVDLGSMLPPLPISYITIVLLAFVLLGFIAGLVKGFGVELLGLIKMAGVIFGAAFAVGFVQPLVADQLNSFIADANVQQTVLYAACFIVIWIVLAIVIGLIKRLFLRRLPGGLSRFTGGLLGIVKGAFIAMVVVYIVVTLAPTFTEVNFFVENAKETDPIGKFLVENNLITKVVDLVKQILAQ